MVGQDGLEPSWPKPADFKSAMYTDFITVPMIIYYNKSD